MFLIAKIQNMDSDKNEICKRNMYPFDKNYKNIRNKRSKTYPDNEP